MWLFSKQEPKPASDSEQPVAAAPAAAAWPARRGSSSPLRSSKSAVGEAQKQLDKLRGYYELAKVGRACGCLLCWPLALSTQRLLLR